MGPMISDIRAVLLDIEGTTSSISFVHDVLFPFALQHIDVFLEAHFDRDDVQQACHLLAADAGFESLQAMTAASNAPSAQQAVAEDFRRQSAADLKATGLKALQGLVWQGGFESSELEAHVFPDVIPMLQAWRAAGLGLRIYSSGSIAAQKMFFGHLAVWGNCLSLFSGHYDTTTGGKKESASYRQIADDWQLNPREIVFISDVLEELLAAREAGLQVVASVRPGNAPLPNDIENLGIDSIRRFDELEIE